MNFPELDARHPDAEVIDRLGGPTKVAELMGILSKPGAVQRVSNWSRRGIPPAVRLQRPDLFPAAAQPDPADSTAQPAEVAGHG